VNSPSSTLPREQDDGFLRRFLSGEPAAVRTVTRWARETAFFRGFGLSAEDREDAVQDALAQVWALATKPGFELRQGLRPVLRTLVAARCIDRVRRRRRQIDLDETLPDTAPSPADALIARDESARLRRALLELDGDCRDIIRQRFFEGLDYATLAAREQRSESTLRVRLFNCLRAIRKHLQKMGA
jgi:RNA polymerase sigma-70 factor (ECF subfamily)